MKFIVKRKPVVFSLRREPDPECDPVVLNIGEKDDTGILIVAMSDDQALALAKALVDIVEQGKK